MANMTPEGRAELTTLRATLAKKEREVTYLSKKSESLMVMRDCLRDDLDDMRRSNNVLRLAADAAEQEVLALRATLAREREEHTAQLAALKVTWEAHAATLARVEGERDVYRNEWSLLMGQHQRLRAALEQITESDYPYDIAHAALGRQNE